LNGSGGETASRDACGAFLGLADCFFAKNNVIMIEFLKKGFIILFTDNVKKIDIT